MSVTFLVENPDTFDFLAGLKKKAQAKAINQERGGYQEVGKGKRKMLPDIPLDDEQPVRPQPPSPPQPTISNSRTRGRPLSSPRTSHPPPPPACHRNDSQSLGRQPAACPWAEPPKAKKQHMAATEESHAAKSTLQPACWLGHARNGGHHEVASERFTIMLPQFHLPDTVGQVQGFPPSLEEFIWQRQQAKHPPRFLVPPPTPAGDLTITSRNVRHPTRDISSLLN